MKNINRSEELFQEAQELFPGGVNSPVRAFGSVGGSPILFKSGSGPYLYDEDGNQYIDYINAWGPAILGHANPYVIAKIKETLEQGLGFGASHHLENALAKKIQEYVPWLERMRFVSSGTEACMSVIRLARAYTQRNKIIKFNGNYHGHGDSFLVKAGSGLATLGIPASPGVPTEVSEHTISLQYNNLAAIEQTIKEYPDQIAAIILEPVVGNSGCITPKPGYLEGIREICTREGILLVFDEVMTGFRVARGGAAERYEITPDLATYGKVIGGGMPVGAYGGRAEVMSQIAPEGSVYQAGTLSGNPISMAAGLATLEQLENQSIYQNLESNSIYLRENILKLAQETSTPLLVNNCGAMLTIFFGEMERVESFEDTESMNINHYKDFFHSLLGQGIYFPPSAYEAAFFGVTHTRDILDKTLTAIEKALKEI